MRGGGPVAIITAAIGISATGIAGQEIRSKTAPVTREVAQIIGVAPEMGPFVVLVGAVLIFVVAIILPGLFLGTHSS